MRTLFVSDPIGGLDPTHDTTVAMMEAAQRRGHEVLVSTVHDLSLQDGVPFARAQSVEITATTTAPGPGQSEVQWFVAGPRTQVSLNDCDVVSMRTDPPVDAAYLRATYLLDLVDPNRCRVVNDPSGLRDANEKIFMMRFGGLIPTTMVSAQAPDIIEFVTHHRRCVLKPIEGMAGRGVLLLQADDPNLDSILEAATLRGAVHVMVQEFLPAVAEGDRRVILVAGRPVGVVRRIARGRDFRCNMATGAAPVKDAIDPVIEKIGGAIAGELLARGLWFVGLDVIGDRVTEINVTSPTGVCEIDHLTGSDLAGDYIAWLEQDAAG